MEKNYVSFAGNILRLLKRSLTIYLETRLDSNTFFGFIQEEEEYMHGFVTMKPKQWIRNYEQVSLSF